MNKRQRKKWAMKRLYKSGIINEMFNDMKKAEDILRDNPENHQYFGFSGIFPEFSINPSKLKIASYIIVNQPIQLVPPPNECE